MDEKDTMNNDQTTSDATATTEGDVAEEDLENVAGGACVRFTDSLGCSKH
ncbi:MAG TPA: hypothetical protein VM536_00790 [Chloroflexia bacterium]|nr:hypothetical protein [Chloroflexia bacterium]